MNNPINPGSTLGQLRRRWANVEPELARRLVFSWNICYKQPYYTRMYLDMYLYIGLDICISLYETIQE